VALLVAGEVAVADDGGATFTPPDPAGSIAAALYLGAVEGGDAFSALKGVDPPADADRVDVLRYYALVANAQAARLTAYLNAAL